MPDSAGEYGVRRGYAVVPLRNRSPVILQRRLGEAHQSASPLAHYFFRYPRTVSVPCGCLSGSGLANGSSVLSRSFAASRVPDGKAADQQQTWSFYPRLIEGGSGPKPHPGFVEVSAEAPFGDGHWAVAGAGKDGGAETNCGRSLRKGPSAGRAAVIIAPHHGPLLGHPTRACTKSRSTRRRRDGRSLQEPRHPPGTDRCCQGRIRVVGVRPHVAATVRPRGPNPRHARAIRTFAPSSTWAATTASISS